MTPSLLALADSHVTLFAFALPFVLYAFPGLERPLTSPYGLLSPGLAHPPPGLGDGLRDRDIGMFGVPGIVASGCVPLREGDVSDSMRLSWVFKLEGTFVVLEAEDRRLR